MNLEIKIFLKPEDIGFQIAGEISELIRKNEDGGRNTFIALSGGNTPGVLFKELAENFGEKIDWTKLHLFWGDERCVPPDDEQSNYGMTKQLLLDKVSIPDQNIHRVRGEDDPGAEVSRIAEEISSIVPHKNDLPQFDLNILGLGEDGHTASLFPGKKLKNVSKNITGIAVHPRTSQKRISLTLDTINNSGQVIFMVTGKGKEDIIYNVMRRKDSGKRYPASNVRADSVLKWYIDQEAAFKINMP